MTFPPWVHRIYPECKLKLRSYRLLFSDLQIPDIIVHDLHVGVQVHIICVYVVLHDMLVNPVYLRSANHVFSQAKNSVHPRIFANGTMICIMLDVKAWWNGILSTYNLPLVYSDLTNESDMKARKESHGKSVGTVVVHVPFHEVEGADEIRCLYVVMPRGKRLQSGHNFVDLFTELHEIGVVLGSVGHTLILSFKSRLCPTMREIAPMVGDEGLRSISTREGLKEAANVLQCSFLLTICISVK